MTARAARNLGLTAHIVASSGWFGAVGAFLSLAIAGLRSSNPELVRSAYVAMDLMTGFVIVPLCLASLLTGVAQSLITKWGLFEHYWVLVKLLMTALATLVLFVHLQPIRDVAQAATAAPLSSTDLRATRLQIAVDAAAALAVLLVATVLAVYKPRGLTRHGWRRQQAAARSRVTGRATSG